MPNELEDQILLSKLKTSPFAKTINGSDWLFYQGESWDINLLLQDFYSFDSDVYASLHLDPQLHEIFTQLSEDKKISVYFDIKSESWVCKSDQTSLQEEFLNWLSLDLNFEITRDDIIIEQ